MVLFLVCEILGNLKNIRSYQHRIRLKVFSLSIVGGRMCICIYARTWKLNIMQSQLLMQNYWSEHHKKIWRNNSPCALRSRFYFRVYLLNLMIRIGRPNLRTWSLKNHAFCHRLIYWKMCVRKNLLIVYNFIVSIWKK